MKVMSVVVASFLIGIVANESMAGFVINESTTPTKATTCAALVIGNSNYKTRPLMSAEADANLLAGALAKKGFRVTKLNDLTTQQIEEAILSFGKNNADVLWFAFSGHGALYSAEGTSHLVGIDETSRRQWVHC